MTLCNSSSGNLFSSDSPTETKVYSPLILEAILPYFSHTQISELKACNRSLRNYIARNWYSLPLKQIKTLKLLIMRNPNYVYWSFESGSLYKDRMPLNKVMDYLNSVKPTELVLDLRLVKHLDPRWIRNAELIHVSDTSDDEEFNELLQHINCHSFSIGNKINDTTSVKLLEGMPCVVKLYLNKREISPTFIERLVEKSKLGPGLQNFHVSADDIMDVNLLFHLLKNASFQHHCLIEILRCRLSGSKVALLEELRRMPGLVIERIYNITIVICYRSSRISISIFNFELNDPLPIHF